jgi:amyloid beta precursor protein binding protein 1
MTGSFPDMTADTASFITLQTIYQEQAKADFDWVMASARDMGVTDEEYVTLFTKNWNQMDLIRFRSLETEYTAPNTDDLAMEWSDEESLIMWYVGLRAVQQFETKNGRWPGVDVTDLTDDTTEVKALGDSLVASMGAPEGTGFPQEYAEEMVRYGNSEIHTMASLMGGIASQEAVKLVTRQYTPANNTFIYSGVHSRGQTIEL